MNRVAGTIVLFVAFLLTACGWHLRGNVGLPPAMANTYIDADINTSSLTLHLNRAFQAAGVVVVYELSKNTATLKINSRSGRKVASIGPNGRAREYDVYVTARFSVTTMDHSFVLPQQEITLTRDLVFDPLDVLGTNNEQKILVDEMERRIAGLIIDRIAAAYRGK